MRISILLAVAAAVAVSAGCAGNQDMIHRAATGNKEGVFRTVDGKGTPAAGYADLAIVSSIKTHRAGLYAFENSGHGKADFTLLVNIDGQPLPLRGDMRHETGRYMGERDPEAGDGVRYTFSQTLRLQPGRHTVTVAIPDDDVLWQQVVELREGNNTLQIRPVYKERNRDRRIGFVGETSYYDGIKGISVVVNGGEVK